MQNRPLTIFILGAGASKPYGLPDGKELKNEIINILSDPTNSEIGRFVMERTGKSENNLKQVADNIRFIGSESIDAFLSTQEEELRKIGKCIIAALIGSLEDTGNITQGEGCWVRWLINNIYDGKSYFDYPLRNTSFWTFNYDRSLEYIIYNTLILKFQSLNRKGEISNSAIVRHLHGYIAEFKPLEKGTASNDYGSFKGSLGNIPDPERHLTMMYEFTNPEEAKNYYNSINHMLKESTRSVWFLGFGYHFEILKWLKPGLAGVPKIYGTAMGIPDRSRNDIISNLSSGIGSMIKGQTLQPKEPTGKVILGLKDQDCLSFLQEHF